MIEFPLLNLLLLHFHYVFKSVYVQWSTVFQLHQARECNTNLEVEKRRYTYDY